MARVSLILAGNFLDVDSVYRHELELSIDYMKLI